MIAANLNKTDGMKIALDVQSNTNISFSFTKKKETGSSKLGQLNQLLVRSHSVHKHMA